MKQQSTRLFLPVLRALVIAVPIVFIGLYLVLAFLRMTYPFELEWMEGSVVDHVVWILNGNPLYVKPSIEFTSAIYTPLYLFLAAGLSKVVGVGFLPLRLISIVTSIGALAVLFRLVHRETKDAVAALLAAGFLAATYKISGAWLDVGRVDSLFLLLLFAAVYLLRFKPSVKYYILAGILAFLSFMTKQSALLACLPLMLYALCVNRRLGLVLNAVVIGLIGVSTLILNYIYDGWYLYYVFHLPGEHPIQWYVLIDFWRWDLVWKVPIAGLIGLIYLFSAWREREERRTVYFYVALTIGFMGSSWSARLHSGGYLNVLIPAYAAIGILMGLGFARFMRSKWNRGWVFPALLYVGCLLQFGRIGYNPSQQLPTSQDREAGEQLLQTVASVDGEVFVPHHGYTTTRVGKGIHAQTMALNDIIRSNDSFAPVVKEMLRESIASGRFAVIISDNDGWLIDRVPCLDSVYTDVGPLFKSDDVFYPVTGSRVRPQHVWVRK